MENSWNKKILENGKELSQGGHTIATKQVGHRTEAAEHLAHYGSNTMGSLVPAKAALDRNRNHRGRKEGTSGGHWQTLLLFPQSRLQSKLGCQ